MQHMFNGSGYDVKPGDTFPCIVCQSLATAKRHKKGVKYCSRKCSGTAKVVNKPIRACPNCQTNFEISCKHPNKTYCSHTCFTKHSSDPDLKISKICEVCDKPFTVYKSVITDSTPRKYCSNKCRGIARSTSAGVTITASGGLINELGYVRILIDGKRVYEHRHVMENMLGRKLLSTESVHHINGDKSDNRDTNLELWISHQPSGQRPEDLVKWAKEILARYDPENSSIT